MKKPVNFASVLFIAAALGLWAWQQAPAAAKVAAALEPAAYAVR
jgi:glycine/D-amino acid oxidase-like deaminating enzyme